MQGFGLKGLGFGVFYKDYFETYLYWGLVWRRGIRFYTGQHRLEDVFHCRALKKGELLAGQMRFACFFGVP